MSELEFWKDLGNIFDAVMNYQKKNVEFNSRFINPWIRLGNVFERQDQTNDAVQAYQRAAEIDPNTAQSWVNLGDAQFKNGAYDEAIEAYRKAVTLDPEAGWPLGNLALSLVTQGRIDEAIPLYKKSIDLLVEVKDKAICWNRLGNAYRKLNDYENAFYAFQKADQLDGDNTGFSDKLDETPPSTSVVAPEEILDQMVVDQNLEASESASTTTEVRYESAAESVQPAAEPVMDAPEAETVVEPIGLAPNMEMKVEENAVDEKVVQPVVNEVAVEGPANENAVAAEEDTPLVLHEKNFDVIQIVEDVIAKVELDYSAQENTEAEEVEVEIAASAASEQEVESIAVEMNEESKSEDEVPVADNVDEEETSSEDAPRRIPTWLVIKDILKGKEKTVAGTEVQEELVQVESVITLSDIPQETAVSESAVNMDVVETYTDPLAAQLTAQPNPGEETISETKGQSEAELAAQETIAADESNQVVESATAQESSEVVDEERMEELAYDEYLKDVVEPTKILTDHMDEIRSEAPITKVSKNGEVRIAMDTKNAHVWNELGNIYLNANACDDAIASYSKAIELDRHFAWPYSNLALAYVQKGRFAEAILLYQRGIELFTTDKDKAITWNRLGNVYRRVNDYSNAIAAYQTADELDPENTTLSLRSSFGLLGNMSPDQKPAFVG